MRIREGKGREDEGEKRIKREMNWCLLGVEKGIREEKECVCHTI